MNNRSTAIALIIIVTGFLFLPKAGQSDDSQSFAESYRQTNREFKKGYKNAGTGPDAIETKDPKSPSQSKPEPRSPAQTDQTSDGETINPDSSNDSLLVPEDRNNVVDPSDD